MLYLKIDFISEQFAIFLIFVTGTIDTTHSGTVGAVLYLQ
jgi:hypothetical protein